MIYHDRMLFHDSFFGLPRAKTIIASADVVKYAAMWKAMKGGEYAPERIRRRAETCIEFWPDRWDCPLKELLRSIPR